MLITVVEYVEPTSDENITVMDTEFSNVSVRLYLPRKAPEGLRRAVVFFHGGGWCLGQAGEISAPRGPGRAVGRVRGLVFHRLNLGEAFGKSPGSFCKEERAAVHISVLKRT